MLSRRPRKWVALWTYGSNDLATVKRIKEEVVPFYREELLEVYVHTEEGKLITPGFIFLRMVDPSGDLLKKVESVVGVGGILTVEVFGPSDMVTYHATIPDIKEIKEGDVVKVVIGPLVGTSGTVQKVTAWSKEVTVKLDVFGRLIEVGFEKEEVRLWKKSKIMS